jgi:predicted RNA-binding Zn-ribbon protein involved in translation (DUF1610 family)
LSDGVCSSCGESFDAETHKLSFVHPNLFGGVDRLCKKCVKHEEEAHRKRVGSSGSREIKAGINKAGR